MFVPHQATAVRSPQQCPTRVCGPGEVLLNASAMGRWTLPPGRGDRCYADRCIATGRIRFVAVCSHGWRGGPAIPGRRARAGPRLRTTGLLGGALRHDAIKVVVGAREPDALPAVSGGTIPAS
jgi:hypothetical protein